MTGLTPCVHFPGTAREGPVALFGADVSGDERPLRSEGLTRPWGDSDGQVIDRYGLHWLIGFEGDESD